MDNNENYLVFTNESRYTKLILPLILYWEPKEDITTYELAQCMYYLVRASNVMPYEIDKTLPYMRHFRIVDPNINLDDE